jgi:hypothetical protein
MGKPANVRKAAPRQAQVIRRSPSGKAAPAHDALPFRRGGPSVPKDKGWCHKCNGWRYYRNVHRVSLVDGSKAFQGKCVECSTVHTFHLGGSR